MTAWTLLFSKRADKDKKNIIAAGLESKTKILLDIISRDPFQNPPEYKKLIGEMAGYYSRRINIQHRLVYEVDEDKRVVKIIRMWTHYE